MLIIKNRELFYLCNEFFDYVYKFGNNEVNE